MKEVLPIVIICCVGIVFCVGYLVYLLIKRCFPKKKRKVEYFDLDTDTLTIKLGNKKSSK